MIRYQDTGLSRLLSIIEKIPEDTPKEELVIEERDDKIIVSFFAEKCGAWAVYIGWYFPRSSLWSGRSFGRDINPEVERAGYCMNGLKWFIFSTCYRDGRFERDRWLVDRLGLGEEGYDGDLWTRELAIEYAWEVGMSGNFE